ncbi:hypothetical protein AKJ09_11317 [Labilithrix luteola]|uniref:Uncharacterized protein n=1 Tax=Labilithrix luteola TaxID=1391654 RepID=A0A0K1QFW3_9BACT|nr:hypothetical protein [Labilithrix luteola]AKV04654.1 hypothetical protein AKJ09_11317 [Labilithrix luteola]
MNNPFERYGLDPREGVEAITRRLKELAEDAKTEAERAEIRAAWEELTLHPARRLRAALFAHPETRVPLGAPPPRTRVRSVAMELGLRDIAPRPSVECALNLSVEERARADEQASAAPSFVDDPLV